MDEHFLGIDIGTTGCKAVIVNREGRVIASAISEYPLYTPKPLWSEQDPDDWWIATLASIKLALTNGKIAPKSILVVGLTGQMHGSVFLDKEDQVIRRALLWNDQRTAKECAEISMLIGEERLIELAGNPALTGFQAPKILWLRNNEIMNYRQVRKVLLPKDYIRLLLTGEYATDCADAAGTLLLDLNSRDWSKEILSKLEIPKEWLPQVHEGSQTTGFVRREICLELGLREKVPVVAGGGDNAAAAIGTGIVRSGLISSSIGTSGVIFAYTEDMEFDPRGRLHTFCHSVPGKYHLMGVTLSAGNSLRWLREILASLVGKTSRTGISYDMLTQIAAEASVGSEGLIFLPYLNGERTPHLDPLASGAIIGLNSRHTTAHLIRAVMEGVVFSLRDSIEIMRGLNVPIEEIRAIGGGGKSSLWRQIQADVFGYPIANLEIEEGPAFGAALLALAANKDAEGVRQISERCVRTKELIFPIQVNKRRYENHYKVYREMYGLLKGSMHILAGSTI